MGETKTCEGDYNDALTIYNSDIIAESYQCSTNSDTMSDIDSATDYGDTNEKKAKQQHRQCFVPRFISYIDSIYMKYSTSVILENKGNTARDHLANERTFLAWFRTSLTLITLGIGIIQVYHVSNANHKRFGRALGLIFVMASILFLYFGNVRYFHAQWALQHGNFPASRGAITSASFCILFLFVGMFTVMLLESKSRS